MSNKQLITIFAIIVAVSIAFGVYIGFQDRDLNEKTRGQGVVDVQSNDSDLPSREHVEARGRVLKQIGERVVNDSSRGLMLNAQGLFSYPAVWGRFEPSLATVIPDVGYTFSNQQQLLVIVYPRVQNKQVFDPSFFDQEQKPTARIAASIQEGKCQFAVSGNALPIAECEVVRIPGAQASLGVIRRIPGLDFQGALAILLPTKHPTLGRVDVLLAGRKDISEIKQTVQQFSFDVP